MPGAFENQVKKFVLSGNRPALPEARNEFEIEFMNLIKECWKGNPFDRPTFKQIRNSLYQMCRKYFIPLSLIIKESIEKSDGISIDKEDNKEEEEEEKNRTEKKKKKEIESKIVSGIDKKSKNKNKIFSLSLEEQQQKEEKNKKVYEEFRMNSKIIIPTRSKQERSNRISCMSWIPGTSFLWIGCTSGFLGFIDMNSLNHKGSRGSIIFCSEEKSHKTSVDCLVYNERTNGIWSGGTDGILRVWNILPTSIEFVLSLLFLFFVLCT